RDGDDEVRISVDRNRAAALGVTPQDAAVSIAAALRGDRLREFRSADRELTLRLAFRGSDRQNIADRARLPPYLPSGQRIERGSRRPPASPPRRLAFLAAERCAAPDLARRPPYLPSGRRIALGAIADSAIERGPRAIQRVNRRASATLGGVIADDATLPVVRE